MTSNFPPQTRQERRAYFDSKWEHGMENIAKKLFLSNQKIGVSPCSLDASSLEGNEVEDLTLREETNQRENIIDQDILISQDQRLQLHRQIQFSAKPRFSSSCNEFVKTNFDPELVKLDNRLAYFENILLRESQKNNKMHSETNLDVEIKEIERESTTSHELDPVVFEEDLNRVFQQNGEQGREEDNKDIDSTTSKSEDTFVFQDLDTFLFRNENLNDKLEHLSSLAPSTPIPSLWTPVVDCLPASTQAPLTLDSSLSHIPINTIINLIPSSKDGKWALPPSALQRYNPLPLSQPLNTDNDNKTDMKNELENAEKPNESQFPRPPTQSPNQRIDIYVPARVSMPFPLFQELPSPIAVKRPDIVRGRREKGEKGRGRGSGRGGDGFGREQQIGRSELKARDRERWGTRVNGRIVKRGNPSAINLISLPTFTKPPLPPRQIIDPPASCSFSPSLLFDSTSRRFSGSSDCSMSSKIHTSVQEVADEVPHPGEQFVSTVQLLMRGREAEFLFPTQFHNNPIPLQSPKFQTLNLPSPTSKSSLLSSENYALFSPLDSIIRCQPQPRPLFFRKPANFDFS